MSRYIDPKTQYFLNNGDVASDGLLYFFENLDYLSPKATYDIDGDTNTNPVVLDGSGRVPEIFGVDLYSVRLVSAAGETQWTVDNYNMSTGASTPSLVNPVITGNITLATLGAKILGDFTNSTSSNRVAIKSSVVNGGTTLDLIPNGTGIVSALNLKAASDPDNAKVFRVRNTSGACIIDTTKTGSAVSPSSIFVGIDGGIVWRYDSPGHYTPYDDDVCNLGSATFRVSTIYAANGTIQTSDERTKKDIEGCELGIDFINSLNPVSYKFIVGGRKVIKTGSENNPLDQTTESIPGNRTHYGLLAQQVKSAVDAAGVDFGGWILTDKNDPESPQGLRYDQFIAPLIKAIQDLSQQNQHLFDRIEALESIVLP